MTPLYSLQQAQEMIQFSGAGKPALGAIFHLKEGPWGEALGHGGRDYRGNYYLSWCCPGKYEITVSTLAEIVKIVASGPEQTSKTIDLARQMVAKQLGIEDLRLSC